MYAVFLCTQFRCRYYFITASLLHIMLYTLMLQTNVYIYSYALETAKAVHKVAALVQNRMLDLVIHTVCIQSYKNKIGLIVHSEPILYLIESYACTHR